MNMTVSIYKKNEFWVLEVNCVASSGPPFHFVKTFSSSTEAKNFLIMNMRMFAMKMGDV